MLRRMVGLALPRAADAGGDSEGVSPKSPSVGLGLRAKVGGAVRASCASSSDDTDKSRHTAGGKSPEHPQTTETSDGPISPVRSPRGPSSKASSSPRSTLSAPHSRRPDDAPTKPQQPRGDLDHIDVEGHARTDTATRAALDRRRKEEIDFVKTHDTSEASQWFIIDAVWLAKWHRFVEGGVLPGPISNESLVHSDGRARSGKHVIEHYRGVNVQVWQFFEQRYGGGPALARKRLHLYSPSLYDQEITSSTGGRPAAQANSQSGVRSWGLGQASGTPGSGRPWRPNGQPPRSDSRSLSRSPKKISGRAQSRSPKGSRGDEERWFRDLEKRKNVRWPRESPRALACLAKRPSRRVSGISDTSTDASECSEVVFVAERDALVVPQPGDGSCLFHALSYGLRDGSSAESLRQEIVRFMEDSPEANIASLKLEDWVMYDSGETVSEYVAQLMDGAWGGAIEIAVFALLKGVAAHVYEECEGGFSRICCFGSGTTVKGTVSVLYQGRRHYDALRLRVRVPP